MSPADILQSLLTSLPPDRPFNLLTFLDAVYEARYTGACTLHIRNGVPHQLDLGQPIRLSIVESERPRVAAKRT